MNSYFYVLANKYGLKHILDDISKTNNLKYSVYLKKMLRVFLRNQKK